MKPNSKYYLVFTLILVLSCLLIACFKQGGKGQNSEDESKSETAVLILYDDKAPLSEIRRSAQLSLGDWERFPYEDAAHLYAHMLLNLIGGFEGLEPSLKGLSSYKAGDAFKFKRTFYLGSSQNAPIPSSFKADVLASAPVTWIGYNFESLDPEQSFQTLGASYASIYESYDQSFSKSFDRILYKGYAYSKFRGPMELLGVSLNDAEVWAWAYTPQGERSPYVLQKDAFWLVADIPFTFLTERDRYLVFADLLWDMLDLTPNCAPQALIRFEDVRPSDQAEDLNRVFSLMKSMGIHFGIATIPVYVNINNGAYLNWSDNQESLNLLQTYQADGWASIFQHGTTHHTDNQKNPDGISGTDWEFWDANSYSPLKNMNADDALKRVLIGKQLLYDAGLNPIGWITPHYAAPTDYLKKFNEGYSLFFERRFVESGLLRNSQFFPFPVKDSLGAMLLPENTNYLSSSNTLGNLLETARANRVLHCPYLGIFMHPYIFNPGYQGDGKTSLANLKNFIIDLQALGYTFVKPTEIKRFSKPKP